MIIRSILTSLVDGVVRLFSANGRIGEAFDQREFVQQYGYASAPKPGAEMLVFVQGNIITAIGSDDRRYRIALASGEVSLYDDLGQKVHLTRTGVDVTSLVRITATAPDVDIVASSQVNITTPLVHISQNVTIGGTLDVTGVITGEANIIGHGNITASGGIADSDGSKTMAGMRDTFNNHTHQENGTGGGTTNKPTQGM